MAIRRMNHAVLYVRSADRTAAFYRDVLGFSEVSRFGNGAGVFMRAPDSNNDHDIAFFSMGDRAADSPAGRTAVGLYHVAWEVATLGDLRDHARRLEEAGALVGASDHHTSKSLYAKDPDGLEFEVCWMVPADLLDEGQGQPIAPLDLEAEIARFGADTPGNLLTR
jgi:catechol-2,3-dioxygenase